MPTSAWLRANGAGAPPADARGLRTARDILKELFQVSFGTPAGDFQIEFNGDPVARLVWAWRRSDEGAWRLVVCVAVQVTAVATSWRVAKSNLGYREYAILDAWWSLEREGDEWTIVEVESTDDGRHYLGGAGVARATGSSLAGDTRARGNVDVQTIRRRA